MLSSLRLNSMTQIGKDEQKKLLMIVSYIIDSPQSAQFLHPVDWKEMGLTNYPLVVKHPMNLLKVQEKLKTRQYKTIEECLDDIQLVWDNCKIFNQEGPFFQLAEKMERSFKKMIKNYLPNIQVTVPSKNGNPCPPRLPNPPPINKKQSTTSKTNKPSKPSRSSSLPSNHIVNEKQPSWQNTHYNYEDHMPLNDEHQREQPEQISQSQKNRLHLRLKSLTQQDLAQVVQVIQDHMPESFKEVASKRYEFHVDMIDSDSFKKINEKIDELLYQGTNNTVKKVKSH